ncbi:MAG: hypothetical protein KGL39_28550, partial [Patescibacteria group bacterium]|nr:hypothetical protein [Patescibacteria group bacterium]
SDINQMVGQSVDGIVVTSQMAQQAMTQLQQKSAQMNEYAKQAARNIQDSFAKFLMDPFKDGLKGMLRSFVKTMDEMAAQALTAKIFAPSSQGGMNAGGLLTQLFGTWLGGASGGAHASGGVAEAGKVSLVGERGPELFVPGMTGTVIPNNVLRASGASHSTAINIDARGAGPDEVSKLLAMRNDIISTVQGNTEFRLQRGSWRAAAPA